MKKKIPSLMKYGILCAICTLVFLAIPDVTYAQDTETAQEVAKYMNMAIKLLSWIWIVPASIAGKLMTNDFTYGTLFHLDVYLWKMRIYMRTFAYFTLGFVFIVLLIKHFVKNDAPSKLGDLLGKVVLAGILIPATWFIIAAIIDIATIATAAVASFPHEILKDQRNSLNNTISLQERYYVKSLDADPLDNTNQLNEQPVELEDILPHADNVAGPLIFMGAAILKLIDTTDISNNQGTSSTLLRKNLTIASVIKVIALLLFVVPLVVLMIVNMIRVFWIWIWIVFSPFIVLDQVFKGPLQANDKIGKSFKMSNMLGLIFQPVATVGLISLGLILLIGVRDVLVGGGQYKEGTLEEKLHIHSDDYGSTFGYNTEIAEVIVTGGFFQDLGSRLGGFVGEMILLLFTVFLLRALVKAGFSMSEITKGVADSIYKFSEGMIKTIPIPGTSLSRAAGSKAVEKVTKDKMGFAAKQREQAGTLNKGIDKFFGIDTSHDIDPSDREKIIKEIDAGTGHKGKAVKFWKAIHALSQDKSLMYNARFKQSIGDWFDRSDALKFLEESKVLTADELKKSPQEIMALPHFLSFVDHVMSNNGEIPTTRAPKKDVTSLEGKKRGPSK